MGGVACERWHHRRLVAGLWPDIDGKYRISPTDLAADRRWSQTFDINDDCGRIGWRCLLDIAGNSIYPCSINLMLSQPFTMARGPTKFWLRYKRKFELTEFHIMRFHYMFTVHWSTDLLEANVSCNLPLVLWRCQLGARKNIRPVKIDWWAGDVAICLERGADCLHMVQLMLLHPKIPSLASFKSRLVLLFWFQLTQVVLEKRPLNRCSSSRLVVVVVNGRRNRSGRPGGCRTNNLTDKNFYVHIISTFVKVGWTKTQVENAYTVVNWFSGKLVSLMPPDVIF